MSTQKSTLTAPFTLSRSDWWTLLGKKFCDELFEEALDEGKKRKKNKEPRRENT